MSVNKLQREKARKRLRALCLEIERHNRLYYKENRPEISDFEYDCLQAEKKALLNLYPEWEENEGPGSDLEGAHFLTVPHLSPMLSLSNTYSREELAEFLNRMEGYGGDGTCVLEPKVDGVAISLVYVKGILDRALTRGDGLTGDVVTDNVKTIPEVPLSLPEPFPEQMEVRGEIYLTERQFLTLNAEQESLGLELYANARNLAAGSLKLLDPSEVAERHLHFIAHGIGFVSDDIKIETQEAVRLHLSQWKFPVFPSIDLRCGLQSIWQFIEAFHARQMQLPYGTDGVVLKLNDRRLQDQLGATAKSPRWAIAYKFEPASAETRLKDIKLQVGRTGVITPVAELEPVVLAGSRVSHATLHNFDEIQRKDVRVGDIVVVQKAGEVIPAIVGVKKEKRDASFKPVEIPTLCPVCHAPLVRVPGEVVIRCTSMNCPPQLKLKIVHFASKEAMDIDGMGPVVVDVLVSQGWINDVADLYNLLGKRQQWIQLPGFSTQSVDNLLIAIETSKKQALWRLLNGLSIPSVGIEVAKNLAASGYTLVQLMDCSSEELQAIPLIGKLTADGIVSFFSNLRNRQIIEKLIHVGVEAKSGLSTEFDTSLIWQGKTFVLTGTMARWTRSEAQKLIESLGGMVGNTVNKKTTALICGNKPGDKLLKARALGIPIWNEEEFLRQSGGVGEGER